MPTSRITALRAARELKLDVLPVRQAVEPRSVAAGAPRLRDRPAAQQVAPRRRSSGPNWPRSTTARTAGIWKPWGSALIGQWDAFLAAWLTKAGSQWNTPAGRDIIWRSRGDATADYLAKIIADRDRSDRRIAPLLPGLGLPQRRS